jgi:O-antigen/teichoic acid export membrane protein
MDKASITYKTVRNIGYSFTNYFWTVLLAFFTLPIIINGLGKIEYGYYIFVGTILSFLGLLDMGIATATNKFISEKYGEEDPETLNRYVGVSKFIFFFIALVGFLILIATSLVALFAFDQKYQFLFIPILISSFTFVFSTVQSLVTIILQATHRFDISSKLGIVFITTQQIIMSIIAVQTQNINYMFLVQLFIAIISYVIGYKIVYKNFPYIKAKILFDIELIKKFYTYGMKTLFINFSNSLLTYFDKLLIPIFMGPQSLTYYTAPGAISTKIPTLANNIGSIVFSMNSHLEGANDKRRQKILYEKSSKIILLIATSLAFSTIIFAKKILEYWLDLDIAENSYVVLIILSLTSILLALYSIIQNTMFSMNKFKEISYATFIMLFINILLLFLLIPVWGINGAALAYLVSVIPVIFLKVYIDKKYFNIKIQPIDKLVKTFNFSLCLFITYLIMNSLDYIATNLLFVITLFGASNVIFLTLLIIFKVIKKEEIFIFKTFVTK